MRLSGVGTGLDFNLVPGGVRWRSELAERVGGASWRSELAERVGGVGWRSRAGGVAVGGVGVGGVGVGGVGVGGVGWRSDLAVFPACDAEPTNGFRCDCQESVRDSTLTGGSTVSVVGVGWRSDLADQVGGASWRSELAERVGGASWRSELAELPGGVAFARLGRWSALGAGSWRGTLLGSGCRLLRHVTPRASAGSELRGPMSRGPLCRSSSARSPADP
jgi:hypothetical protein